MTQSDCRLSIVDCRFKPLVWLFNRQLHVVNRKSLLALAFFAAFAAAGCSNIEKPDLDKDVREQKLIPPAWQPLPLRVGLAPFAYENELNAEKTNLDK